MMAGKALLSVALLLVVSAATAQPYTKFSDMLNTRRDMKFLKEALVKTNLLEAVDAGDFMGTVFAPKDVAFTRLAKQMNTTVAALLAEGDDLLRVLMYHVSPEVLRKIDLLSSPETTIPTLAMQDITAKRNLLKVKLIDTAGRAANIDKYNIEIGDIVVHVIDQILVPDFDVTPGGNNTDVSPHSPPSPPSNTNSTTGGGSSNSTTGGSSGNSTDGGAKTYANLWEAISDLPDAKAMQNTVQLVAKEAVLQAVTGPCTVFIPTEKAFLDTVEKAKALVPGGKIDWTDPLIRSVFTPILQFHIVKDQALKAADLKDGQQLVTALGPSPALKVSIVNGVVSVQGLSPSNVAKVVKADIPLGKCVGHLVDGVLVPLPLPVR